MNALAATEIEPALVESAVVAADPAAPGIDLLLYLADFDDAAVLANETAAAADNERAATPADSPPATTTDRSDAAPDRQ